MGSEGGEQQKKKKKIFRDFTQVGGRKAASFQFTFLPVLVREFFKKKTSLTA